jgi:hypothetical protein
MKDIYHHIIVVDAIATADNTFIIKRNATIWIVFLISDGA